MKGEQKLEEMIDVLSHLHKYVPTVTEMDEVEVQGKEDTVKVIKDCFYDILIGMVS